MQSKLCGDLKYSNFDERHVFTYNGSLIATSKEYEYTLKDMRNLSTTLFNEFAEIYPEIKSPDYYGLCLKHNLLELLNNSADATYALAVKQKKQTIDNIIKVQIAKYPIDENMARYKISITDSGIGFKKLKKGKRYDYDSIKPKTTKSKHSNYSGGYGMALAMLHRTYLSPYDGQLTLSNRKDKTGAIIEFSFYSKKPNCADILSISQNFKTKQSCTLF